MHIFKPLFFFLNVMVEGGKSLLSYLEQIAVLLNILPLPDTDNHHSNLQE